MLTIGCFEERASADYHAGKIYGVVHCYIGEEAVAVGVCEALEAGDQIISTHRGHGHCIAKGADLQRMMAELYGRQTGYCKGKGGSMHIADFGIGMLGANGIVAGGISIVTGAGLAAQMEGKGGVAVSFFGDGASDAGPFHECLNIAAAWKLPMLYICENNMYAAQTSAAETHAMPDVAGRAAGYGIPGVVVDGNDIFAVYQAAARAITRARAGEGPTLIEAIAYRLASHTTSDDARRYRVDQQVEEWRQKDAIEKGARADKALTVLIVRINELLGNKELAMANADALRGLPKEFFTAARQTLPQIAPGMRERLMAVADATTASTQFAPADQLAAQLIKIRVAKAYAPDGKVPTDVRTVALQTATKMLAVKQDPYVRAGVVNSAINIYIALDDWARARDLLALEASTSNTPHYYIGDWADAEEHLGNNQKALELLAEAYQEARGPASRFQWGFQFLDGLLRLAPDDVATIGKVGLAVLAELDGPNRIHRRTLSRLTRLDKSLRQWNTTSQRAAVVGKFRTRVEQSCAKSPGDLATEQGCSGFGGVVAAAG